MARRERKRPQDGVWGRKTKSANLRSNPKRFAVLRASRYKKTPTETNGILLPNTNQIQAGATKALI